MNDDYRQTRIREARQLLRNANINCCSPEFDTAIAALECFARDGGLEALLEEIDFLRGSSIEVDGTELFDVYKDTYVRYAGMMKAENERLCSLLPQTADGALVADCEAVYCPECGSEADDQGFDWWECSNLDCRVAGNNHRWLSKPKDPQC